MAETEQVEEGRLKYLGFFQVAVLKATACLSSLYDYAKENSGPLKGGVETVEQTVKTVVGPVYYKIEGKPFQLLHFVDGKVDDTICKLDEHLPPTVKQRVYQVYDMAKQAPDVARSLFGEVQTNGIIGTASERTKDLYIRYEPTAKYLYAKYEPVAEEWTLFAWHKLLQLPLFPQIVHIFIPTATYWSDKYNHIVLYLADKNYQIAAFLPLVPIEKIKKVLERSMEKNKKKKVEIAASS
ncbi:hypothetical protein KI387_016179 [Taxus chinensis]|uniref:Uncharacterized protein n=1 Tax=Taxus chinensis TaxID=29808 RepID=A0AA38GHP8_TAXCH|nr:hypothetical protein KI387_016179 [Taxus chinensis]